jgi:hypothetical protein
VRGAGVMLGFDVARPDVRDALLDRAFRRGLLLLPAGERSVRFYPRYDTEASTIDEALAILRRAVEDLVGGHVEAGAGALPRIRVGTVAIPLDTLETIDITGAGFAACEAEIEAVEHERYGATAPLLQLPMDTLRATSANSRAIGVALRDRVSGRTVGYALGSALEDHDEEGVSADPRLGENNTFYLQALATLPTVQNSVDLENRLLDVIRERAAAAGFEFVSMLVEDWLRETAPAWVREAPVLRHVDNYLASGVGFSYLQTPLAPANPTS